jgi:hypothetical protein
MKLKRSIFTSVIIVLLAHGIGRSFQFSIATSKGDDDDDTVFGTVMNSKYLATSFNEYASTAFLGSNLTS